MHEVDNDDPFFFPCLNSAYLDLTDEHEYEEIVKNSINSLRSSLNCYITFIILLLNIDFINYTCRSTIDAEKMERKILVMH